MLTVQEVCELLRVSRRTLERWRRQPGGLRPLRLGRLIRYREADVERYVNRAPAVK